MNDTLKNHPHSTNLKIKIKSATPLDPILFLFCLILSTAFGGESWSDVSSSGNSSSNSNSGASGSSSSTNGNGGTHDTATQDGNAKAMGSLAAGLGSSYCGYQAAQVCPSCSTGAGCTNCALWVAGTVIGTMTASSLSSSEKTSRNTEDATLSGGNSSSSSSSNSDPYLDPNAGSSSTSSGSSSSSSSGGSSSSNPNAPGLSNYSESLDTLKKAGVKIGADGSFTLPDGKTYKISDFSSSQAMSKAGLPSGSFEAYKKNMSDAAQFVQKNLPKIKDFQKGLAEGDGSNSGGGWKKQGPSSGSKNTPAVKYGNPFLPLPSKNPGGLGSIEDKGLRIQHGGDWVGVASDDIFHMINVRYNLEMTLGHLL